MSTKLLKRMLQETNGGDGAVKGQKHARSSLIDRKRKRRRKEENGAPRSQPSDLVNDQIQRILSFDRIVSKASSEKGAGGSLARIKRQNTKKSKIRKESASLQIGNSRDSSSKMTLKEEPTFNKKLHNEQTEKRKLLAVAKLLKKNAKKKGKF